MKRRSDEKKSRVSWSATEDDGLLKAVFEDTQNREAEGDAEDEEDWDEIAKKIPDKTPVQCLKRHMILIKRKSNDDDGGGGEDNISSTAAAAAAAAASITTTDTDTTTTAKTTSQEERKMTLEEKVKEEEEKGAPPVDDEEEDDDDNDDDDEEGKDSKRPRKEGDPSTKWPQDDIDLLKKLVENYKDCKSR
ncbi:MAG: hypothetical protein ACI8RD_000735 [Bacillariaceae sp.]|jgi:hypothetical protein